MKIAAIIARILLGLAFVVFGLNVFFHFLPGSNMVPPGAAGEFVTVLSQSHYMQIVAALQVLGGILLLTGFFVPLGLLIFGPILVNILLFHLFLFHTGIQMGLLCTVLWLVVFAYYRTKFAGIFER
ncbi:DoxX family membrane protein [Silvibacterium sp.]|uniref:DoxX family membrane protein n=1 Tax=Silvibacterium sp. TaxID=1964179 RepID=UPI0039E50E6C